MIKESIHTLVPLDLSGRHSRRGFAYQDHVGVSLCMRMLEDEKIKEIWFETEDDIAIIWNEDEEDVIEFIQVKNENRTSRWSVSAICSNSGTKESMLEKSLKNDRCLEKTRFRVITSYDVDNALSFLKSPLGGKFRKEDQEKEASLIKTVTEQFPELKSPNGNGVDYWIKNCHWDKSPDSPSALEAENKLFLEEILKKKPKHAFWDQRDELYQQFLGLIKKASTDDVIKNPNISKIKRTALVNWFEQRMMELGTPKGGTENLQRKLKEAGIDEVLIKKAEELKWQYMEAKLDSDFVKSKEYSEMERKISSLLLDLKLKLDAGKLDLDGVNFLLKCKEEVEKTMTILGISIPQEEALAYMFDHTNRCLHRFIRPNK